jgi:hypothetical protein
VARPCFTENRLRSWRAAQGINKCALVALAQLDNVSRFERANRCLVNAADDEVRQSNATCDHVAQAFEQYLLRERALVRVTVVHYLPFIRRFLTDRFGTGRVRLSQLRARDVTRFVQRQAPRLHLKRAKLMTTALTTRPDSEGARQLGRPA